MINEFISEYGTTILYTLLTAIFGFLGMAVKRIIEKLINDKIKDDTAEKVVLAVEQMFKDLHGDEKLEKAKMFLVDALQKKGITISELELRILIEAAIKGFNGGFNKNEPENNATPNEDDTEESSAESNSLPASDDDLPIVNIDATQPTAE